MPAITLSNLAWSTPDGTRLFDDLTLGFGRERAGLIVATAPARPACSA